MFKKFFSNLSIYRQDLKEKGLLRSITDRLRRNKTFNRFYNFFKSDKINFNGLTLFIDKEDTVVSECLLRTKQWEPFEMSIFKQCLHLGDTIVDLGAHIGTYTLTASSLVGKNGHVFAFEPSPRNYALLSKNVSFNHLKNVSAINQAVTDQVGSLNFYLEAENTGDNRIYGDSHSQKTIKVKTVNLDSFFKKKSNQINLIKMDIQGAEPLALKGAAQLLKKNKDIIIFIEFWPHGLSMTGSSSSELIKLLSGYGFEFYEINETEKNVSQISAASILKRYKQDSLEMTNLVCGKHGNKRLSGLIS